MSISKTRTESDHKRILVIDVGGTHVKVLATGQREKREIPSSPTMTARKMVLWSVSPGTGSTAVSRSAIRDRICI